MSLNDLLDRLAAVEPSALPFISLYVDARPDSHGRDHFEASIRQELHARAGTYPPHSPQRESFDRDVERVMRYLHEELQPSSNCAAIFARGGEQDVFDAVQLDKTIEGHLHVGSLPHLYPLARLGDEYRRYAVVLTDSNSARLFVFGVDGGGEAEHVQGRKMTRSAVGGWSQARYQRHVENFHLHHVKEVVETLERVVRAEGIERIVLAGDEVIVPRLKEQLPQALAERVVDVLRLEMTASERDVYEATLAAMREQDARDDAGKVERMLNAYRSGGLGVAGLQATRAALENGQVEELLLSATLDPSAAALADELVSRVHQTAARVTFIADPALLAEVGGVGALLRYRIGTMEKAA